MSEDLSRSANPPTGERTTEEWIGMLADSEGRSKTEIVERMVASYWTLKEMDGMMEQLEMRGLEGATDVGPTGLEPRATGSNVDDLKRIAERVEALEKSHGAIEERVITEFGNLRTILSYLMEKTDSLEADLAGHAPESAGNPTGAADEKRLTDLRTAASRHGVSRASCDNCGTSLDMALLPTPDCPECERRFTSLQPSKRWFGLGTDVLTVAEASDDEAPAEPQSHHGAVTDD